MASNFPSENPIGPASHKNTAIRKYIRNIADGQFYAYRCPNCQASAMYESETMRDKIVAVHYKECRGTDVNG